MLSLLSLVASVAVHMQLGLSATEFPGWEAGLAWMVVIGGGIGATAGLLSAGRRDDGRPGIQHSKVCLGWG